MKPMLMIFTPCASSGMIRLFSTGGGEFTPIIRGMFGPYTSASRMPTRDPRAAIATARLVVTVDLPTPPLPLDTARMRPRCGYAIGVGADGLGGAFGA